MKLKFLTSQIKFDIETWNLNQIQIKFWRFDLKFDSNSNLLACQKLKLDSSSSSNRDFRLASRIKSTHSSLKLDLTINLFMIIFFIRLFLNILNVLINLIINILICFFFDNFDRFILSIFFIMIKKRHVDWFAYDWFHFMI